LSYSSLFDQLIHSEMSLAGATIDHWVRETFDMPRSLENRGMSKDRTVHTDYVIALMHHHAPPVILKVALQFDSKRAVIPGAIESAVDFARLENETSPLAQADDLFHPLRVSGHSH
jgi:hypothetical protein